jgi:trehalose-6-phosphate synthase
LIDAITLMNDIGFANVTNVQNFVTATDAVVPYTGRKGTLPNFTLSSGQANYVRMATTVNYIVVGSDNPALAYVLREPNPGGTSNSGTNFYAYNYHQTATDAIGLMNDIGFASVTNVQNFVTLTDAVVPYTGRKGTLPNFTLTPGRGYYVRVVDGIDINYTPSHY